MESFFRDLCTLSELEAMAHRWEVVQLLDQGLPYQEISRRTGASTTTVTRVAHWLRHGEGGYRAALDRRTPALPESLKVAVPVKGRLREPAITLLEDAGLGPERPGERALAFPCRNAPVEVLLVRAADIPEYVQDGVVDCGITGADLVPSAERESPSSCGSVSEAAGSRPPSRGVAGRWLAGLAGRAWRRSTRT